MNDAEKDLRDTCRDAIIKAFEDGLEAQTIQGIVTELATDALHRRGKPAPGRPD